MRKKCYSLFDISFTLLRILEAIECLDDQKEIRLLAFMSLLFNLSVMFYSRIKAFRRNKITILLGRVMSWVRVTYSWTGICMRETSGISVNSK